MAKVAGDLLQARESARKSSSEVSPSSVLLERLPCCGRSRSSIVERPRTSSKCSEDNATKRACTVNRQGSEHQKSNCRLCACSRYTSQCFFLRAGQTAGFQTLPDVSRGSLTRSIGKAKLQRQQAERLAAEASPALAASGRSGSMLNSAAASGLMLVASEARSHVQQAPCRIAASSVSSVTRSSRLELQRGERRWRDQTPHQVPDCDIRA